MRVLVLCKRQYTGKDLLEDRYGRLFELPAGLAARGHQVEVLMSAYRPCGRAQRDDLGARWMSMDALPWPLACLNEYVSRAAHFRPDVLWASSDVLHILAGRYLAMRLGVPVVLDFYDDYEAFGLTRLPGLRFALRRACADANGISVVSHSLAQILPKRGQLHGRLEIIGNGVSDAFTSDLAREQARQTLNLPSGAVLVGTAGALDESRGIEDLLAAHAMLRERVPGVRLVLAGPRSTAVAKAFPEDVIDLGQLPHAQVSTLLRALDVGVICNRDSAFGRACHPMKLVEMVACELPIVASSIGETAILLSDQPECLYEPGNARQLADRIVAQLKVPILAPSNLVQSWAAAAKLLEQLLGATTSLPNSTRGRA